MAIIYSDLVLRYDGAGSISVIRRYTNADNSGTQTTTLVNERCVPSGANLSLFEMQVGLSNGANIASNPFQSFRSLDAGAAEIVHRLSRDDSEGEGTVVGNSTLSVVVRRKAYTTDSVSGNVVFNNSLTVTGSNDPDPEPGVVTYEARFLGADQYTGSATLAIERSAGLLRIRERLVGTWGNGDNVDSNEIVGSFEIQQFPVVAMQCRVTVTSADVDVNNGQSVNNAASWNSAENSDLYYLRSLAPNGPESTVTFTIQTRRQADLEVVDVRQFRFITYTNN